MLFWRYLFCIVRDINLHLYFSTNFKFYSNIKIFFLAISAWSALEILIIMRYINLHLHLHYIYNCYVWYIKLAKSWFLAHSERCAWSKWICCAAPKNSVVVDRLSRLTSKWWLTVRVTGIHVSRCPLHTARWTLRGTRSTNSAATSSTSRGNIPV